MILIHRHNLSENSIISVGFDSSNKFQPAISIRKREVCISLTIQQYILFSCLKQGITIALELLSNQTNSDKNIEYIDNIYGLKVNLFKIKSKIRLLLEKDNNQIFLSKKEYKRLVALHPTLSMFCSYSEFTRKSISSFYIRKYRPTCKRLKTKTLYGVVMKKILPKTNGEFYERLVVEFNMLHE